VEKRLDWIREAGSKHFLEPRALILLAVPPSVVVSVVASFDGTLRSTGHWLLANVLALTVLGAVVFGVRILRRWGFLESQIRLPIVFLISFILGALKSYLTRAFMVMIDGSPVFTEDIAGPLIGGGLAGAIAIPLVAAFASVREELELDRDKLISHRFEKELLESARLQEDESLEKLVKELKSFRSKLDRDRPESSSISYQLGLLSELALNSVRPLSHRLFQQIEDSFPKVSWRELLKSGSRNGSAATFAALLNLLALPRNIEVLGVQLGVGYSLTTSFLLLFSIKIVERINPRLPIRSEVWVGLGLAASVLLSYGFAFSIYPPLGPNRALLMVGVMAWLTQSSLVYLVIRELFRLRNESHLDLELETPLSNSAATERDRANMAQLLHGHVQSRLMSLELRARLDRSLAKELALRELDQIIEMIANPERSIASTEERMQGLMAHWDGFLKVSDFDLETSLELQSLRPEVFPIIEEAISNSYRHGLAKEATLTIRRLGSHLQITITDDGTGPRGGGAGMGSRLFEELSKSWSLSANPEGGSRFEALLLAKVASEANP
jgi:signal transduction histidine kinase